MGTRGLTMTKPQISPVFRRIFFLLLKMGLLVFLTMAAGWGYGYALLETNFFPEFVNRLAVILMSSAFSGLLARFLLKRDGLFPAYLGAALSVAVSLLDLANLSGGLIGLAVSHPGITVLNSPGLWQLLPVPFVLFVALQAWRQPRLIPQPAASQTKSNARPVKSTSAASARPARKNTRRKSFSLQKRIAKPVRSFIKKTGMSLKRFLTRAKTDTGNAVRKAASALPKGKTTSPAPLPVVKFHRAARAPAASAAALSPLRRQTKAIHSPIRLVGREEHRCPYCLCIVSPRDPDGVVICPVCHTYHHKSCWDVTGACQVPHIHP